MAELSGEPTLLPGPSDKAEQGRRQGHWEGRETRPAAAKSRNENHCPRTGMYDPVTVLTAGQVPEFTMKRTNEGKHLSAEPGVSGVGRRSFPCLFGFSKGGSWEYQG